MRSSAYFGLLSMLMAVAAIALIPALLGVLVGCGGFLGWRERLPRDRGAGVRTTATLRSDEAFRVGNRIAGLPTMVAGGIGIVSGAVVLAMPHSGAMIVVAAVGVCGVVGLLAAGGILGHRAAAGLPASRADNCVGCACTNSCSVLRGTAASSVEAAGAEDS